MDTAVALVSAYLRLNGYFVQTEVPVARRVEEDPARYEQATDIDILAIRFPARAHAEPPLESDHWAGIVTVDPALDAPTDETDVVIAEVTEGQSRPNPNLLSEEVLTAALQHTGGCMPEEVGRVVDDLIGSGLAETTHCHGGNHRFRILVFGGTRPETKDLGYHVVTLADVLDFVRSAIRENHRLFHVLESKDPVLSLLMLINDLEGP